MNRNYREKEITSLLIKFDFFQSTRHANGLHTCAYKIYSPTIVYQFWLIENIKNNINNNIDNTNNDKKTHSKNTYGFCNVYDSFK